MKGYVYILYSDKTNKYYIGSTNNLERRLRDHNNSNTPSTTFGKPWNIKFFQEFTDLKIARKIEHQIKKYKSKIIIEKIIATQSIKFDG